jgi:hypothetical protein
MQSPDYFRLSERLRLRTSCTRVAADDEGNGIARLKPVLVRMRKAEPIMLPLPGVDQGCRLSVRIARGSFVSLNRNFGRFAETTTLRCAIQTFCSLDRRPGRSRVGGCPKDFSATYRCGPDGLPITVNIPAEAPLMQACNGKTHCDFAVDVDALGNRTNVCHNDFSLSNMRVCRVVRRSRCGSAVQPTEMRLPSIAPRRRMPTGTTLELPVVAARADFDPASGKSQSVLSPRRENACAIRLFDCLAWCGSAIGADRPRLGSPSRNSFGKSSISCLKSKMGEGEY